MKLGWTGKGTLGDTGGNVILGDGGGNVRTAGCGGTTMGSASLGDSGRTVRTAVWGGTTMGSAGFAMAFSNMLERSTMDCFWASPNWANEAAGAGLARASVRARAATMAASTEEVLGTGHWCGKFHFFAVRSALVFGT